MDKRQSKDMLRKEEQRIIEEIRKLDLEGAQNNLRDDNEGKLSWDDNDNKEKKREKLRKKLEEIQSELGSNNLA